jgi:hypothetical protein
VGSSHTADAFFDTPRSVSDLWVTGLMAPESDGVSGTPMSRALSFDIFDAAQLIVASIETIC